MCGPTSGNVVDVLWSKPAPSQFGSENLWQLSHVVGNACAACGGFLEFW